MFDLIELIFALIPLELHITVCTENRPLSMSAPGRCNRLGLETREGTDYTSTMPLNPSGIALSVALLLILSAGHAWALPEDFEEQVRSVRKRTQGLRPDVGPVGTSQEKDPKDWETAKKNLVGLWAEGLGRYGLTRRHLEFWEQNGKAVIFGVPPAGKTGTYDEEKKAPWVSEASLEWDWRDHRTKGLSPVEALKRVARDSLPILAHLLRDGMTRAELKSRGIDWPSVALMEDEILHEIDESRVRSAVEGKEELGADSAALSAVEDYGLEKTPAVLTHTREDLVGRFRKCVEDPEYLKERPQEERESLRRMCERGLRVLSDENQFRALQEYFRKELARYGLDPGRLPEIREQAELRTLETERKKQGEKGMPWLPSRRYEELSDKFKGETWRLVDPYYRNRPLRK